VCVRACACACACAGVCMFVGVFYKRMNINKKSIYIHIQTYTTIYIQTCICIFIDTHRNLCLTVVSIFILRHIKKDSTYEDAYRQVGAIATVGVRS